MELERGREKKTVLSGARKAPLWPSVWPTKLPMAPPPSTVQYIT